MIRVVLQRHSQAVVSFGQFPRATHAAFPAPEGDGFAEQQDHRQAKRRPRRVKYQQSKTYILRTLHEEATAAEKAMVREIPKFGRSP
ncbi:hypothetical protein [Nannocystis exedens]|uniref:hypothetical protein n=1 Tax=Nannocystis exedens TaxID=54 RepID=UPI0011602281|nr:hypothetical protein [Nannocystis exedens]